MSATLKKLARSNLTILVLVILVIGVVMTLASSHFFTADNLKNLMSQTTVYGLLAIGMTFVILTGGIDLSVGSNLALSGVVLALCIKAALPVWAAIVACLGVGTLGGMLNGALVSYARIPPFIVTMGATGILRGIALVVTNGSAITGLGSGIIYLGSGQAPLGIPVSFVITIICFAVAFFVLEFTRFGRYIYILGGSGEAARLSGVRVNINRFLAYAICGLTAAVASIVISGRLNSAQPIAAEGYELDAIAAVILGGTSMNGGEGSIVGTLLGTIIMTMVRNGMNLLGVHTYFQKIVIGVIIIIAVMFDMFSRSREAEK